MSEAEPTVFVVDDEVSVRESLKLLIESVGWQAQTFPSAQAFLARPRVVVPSCVVLDLVLPDFNGCDLQSLLADRTDMPVIFITGYGDVPTTVRAMKGGAVDFFTKPVNGDALLRAIQNAIDRSCVSLRQARMCALYRRITRRSAVASARSWCSLPLACSTSKSAASSALVRLRSRLTGQDHAEDERRLLGRTRAHGRQALP
jgi:FixJ family two-component response regulator